MLKFLLLVATTAFGFGMPRSGRCQTDFSVNGEEGLSLARLQEIQAEKPFYTLRVSHWAPGKLVLRATDRDTLRVKAKTGSEPIPISITGSYQHIDIDIASLSDSQSISAEIEFPQAMLFDEVQLTASTAAVEVSGHFQANQGVLGVKSGHGPLRVHDLQFDGKVELTSIGPLELSDARMKTAHLRILGKHSMKVHNTEAEALNLSTENGILCLSGYHHHACAQITKGGEIHVQNATFHSPLKVVALLSHKVCSKIQVRQSFLPKDMSLHWQVHDDDMPDTGKQVMQVDGLNITFGDLLTHGGLFSLREHLHKRGADDLCQQIFRKASPGWSPSGS